MPAAWPSSLIPNDMRWGVQTNTLGLVSPLVAGGGAYPLAGARWVCEMTLRNLTEAQQRELAGFLDRLAGQSGRLVMPLWLHGTQRGAIAGAVLATGAKDAVTVGLTGITGANPTLRPGDMLGIAGTLYRVLKPVTHTAGAATAIIAPPLRGTFTAEPVALSDLTCFMRLDQDDANMGRYRPGGWGDFTCRFVEVVRDATPAYLLLASPDELDRGGFLQHMADDAAVGSIRLSGTA